MQFDLLLASSYAKYGQITCLRLKICHFYIQPYSGWCLLEPYRLGGGGDTMPPSISLLFVVQLQPNLA